MEDAHLAVSPLSDGKSSLFAIFDGHGGILLEIFKVHKLLSLYQDISFVNYKKTIISLVKIIN